MAHSVVIGGAGFVGSWVVEEILKDPNNRVTIIDNLISSEKWNLSNDPRVTFIEGSAAELTTFQKIDKPINYLYQLACFHGNQSSIAKPLDDLENGLKTTLVALEWLKNNSATTRIIYAGAGCAVARKIWDKPEATEETDFINLLQDSPYSISKIGGEMYCQLYARLHNLDIIRIRFQNVYGPREILGAGIWRGNESTIWRNVVPTFIWKALHNAPLNVTAQATRDFVYVEDLAHAVVKIANHAGTPELFNVATGIETSIHDLALKIIEFTRSNSEIILTDRRKWDNSGRRLGSPKKLTQILNLRMLTDIDEGLQKTIRWTTENCNRIEKEIKKHKANFTS